MHIQHAVVAVAIWSVAAAQSAAPSSFPTGTPISPCASVSILSAQFVASATGVLSTAVPTVPAQVANDCLNSVPINQTIALSLLDSIVPYLQFQSTPTYLKNPPPGWPFPALDLYGGIQTIRQKVSNNSYAGEYAFQLDLYNFLTSAHDGHLQFKGDTLSVFEWERGQGSELVSVSLDGHSLPSIYLWGDLLLTKTNPAHIPQAVTSIDGTEPVSFIESMSLYFGLQDLDALYNMPFFSLAQHAYGKIAGTFVDSNNYQFPGPNTSITFANNRTVDFKNTAKILVDFTNVDDGQSFYDKFCRGKNASPSGAATSSAASSAIATPSPTAPSTASPQYAIPPGSGYPYPVVAHSEKLIAGYFLNDTNFTDVAVLSILSFDATLPATLLEFQSVMQQFLTACNTAGKTKLVIDLQANPGGTFVLAYEAFLQLFPTVTPYGAANARAHDSLNMFGIADDYQLHGQNAPDSLVIWQYENDLTVNNTQFDSWQDVYGPHQIHGDNFTSLMRINLSGASETILNLTGYGSRTNFTVQPFAAEDIIMVTDGYCASTCAVYSEFMKTQGKVKAISLGGRPLFQPSQAVGGVKGANELPWEVLYEQAVASETNITTAISAQENQTDLVQISQYPLTRAKGPSLNFKNNIRMNDTTITPLHFVYEASDCRLWFTPKMTWDVTEIWRTTASVAFGNQVSLCVTNSTGDPTSLSGNGVLNGTAPLSTPASTPSSTTSATTNVSPSATTFKGTASSLSFGIGSLVIAGAVVIANIF